MGSGGVCASSHIGSLASALVPLREFTRVMEKLEVRGYNIKSGAGFAGFAGYLNGFAASNQVLNLLGLLGILMGLQH